MDLSPDKDRAGYASVLIFVATGLQIRLDLHTASFRNGSNRSSYRTISMSGRLPAFTFVLRFIDFPFLGKPRGLAIDDDVGRAARLQVRPDLHAASFRNAKLVSAVLYR